MRTSKFCAVLISATISMVIGQAAFAANDLCLAHANVDAARLLSAKGMQLGLFGSGLSIESTLPDWYDLNWVKEDMIGQEVILNFVSPVASFDSEGYFDGKHTGDLVGLQVLLSVDGAGVATCKTLKSGTINLNY